MYQDYESLKIDLRPDGVLLVSIRARKAGQAANRRLHSELGRVGARGEPMID